MVLGYCVQSFCIARNILPHDHKSSYVTTLCISCWLSSMYKTFHCSNNRSSQSFQCHTLNPPPVSLKMQRKGYTDFSTGQIWKVWVLWNDIQSKLYQHKQKTLITNTNACCGHNSPIPFWSCSTNTLANACAINSRWLSQKGSNLVWVWQLGTNAQKSLLNSSETWDFLKDFLVHG